MTDVVQKVRSSEPIRSGWAVVYVDQQGNTQRLAPEVIEDQPTESGYFNSLGNRFDDTTYYTA